METTNYFALTIGPIFRTLALARHTRELWGASYLFSFFIGEIVKLLPNYDSIKKEGLILPCKVDTEIRHAGLYPDRIIYASKSKAFTKQWDSFLKKACKQFPEKIGQAPSTKTQYPQYPSSADLSDFLEKYLQIYSLQIELPVSTNPVTTIFPLLDSLEQRALYHTEYSAHPLRLLLKNIKASTLFTGIFETKYRFPSVLEIAAQGLKINNPAKFDEIFAKEERMESTGGETQPIQDLKTAFPSPTGHTPAKSVASDLSQNYFRFHHKYMAVVQADGDNIGRLFDVLFESNGLEAINQFSSLMIHFGAEATGMIEEFGGVPIYLGGDDQLFFAPAKTPSGTVFSLIKELDTLFNETIQQSDIVRKAVYEWNKRTDRLKIKRKKIVLPTLSFGVSISYHKHPLNESLESALSLLFNTAKMMPGKNALSFEFLKHSGHQTGATFRKEWVSYNQFFLAMLSQSDLEDTFLTSVQHKLEALRSELKRILTGRLDLSEQHFKTEVLARYLPNEAMREFLLRNLVDNFFNETIPKTPKASALPLSPERSEKEAAKTPSSRAFLELVFNFLLETYRDMETTFGNSPQTADKAIDQTYACLRLVHFYLQKD